MRRIYDALSATKRDKSARRFLLPLVLMASILLPFIVEALISFSEATPSVSAQQSTAEACRETKKVLEQYQRELKEIVILITFKDAEQYWRAQLSELRRAIANGVLVTGLNSLATRLGLPAPGSSTKERLAFQKRYAGWLRKGWFRFETSAAMT